MKVLLTHNYYQHTGGEDRSYADERKMLRDRGHEVVEYNRSNEEIKQINRALLAGQTIWNRKTYRELRQLIQAEKPDLMHCTNTFPLISPAAYSAARSLGVPVVQSLRNYRLLCPSAVFMREGKVCQSCMGKTFATPAIQHGCYRESRAASAVVAGMLAWHKLRGTWQKDVDIFFTPTEFAREKYIEGGFPADRILVKPNCVDPDPGVGDGSGGYAVFVGRLAPEKGIETLLSAWRRLGDSIPLKIVGDGPLAPVVQDACKNSQTIEWLGELSHREALDEIGRATMLVMPSRWYETFGRAIIEAYAKGTPVIASNLGAMADLILPEKTGLLFEPSNGQQLAQCVRRLADSTLTPMRINARLEYEKRFTSKASYESLMNIYDRALETVAGRSLMRTGRGDAAPPVGGAVAIGQDPAIAQVNLDNQTS